MKFALTKQDRMNCESNIDIAIPESYSLNCHMGIWDEGVSDSRRKRSLVINQTSRSTGCFYFPYHAAMAYDAAKELQKRQSDNEQLKKSNL